MKAAASRTGKKVSYWKRFRQLSSEQNKIIMKKEKKKEKATLGCSDEGCVLSYSAVRRHACQSGLLQAAQTLGGRALLLPRPAICRRYWPPHGGEKIPSGKALWPYQQQEEEERKRGRKRLWRGMCECLCVCLAERKCQLSHEYPTSLPSGQQLVELPVILATNRVEDKDIAHTYYAEGKKIPYFLYIATITELRKYTVGGIIIQKSPSCSLLLDKTHPFWKINSDRLPQFLMPAESCSLYNRQKKKEKGKENKKDN